MHIFYSFNKPYFNYNRKKPRKRQYNIVFRYCDNYNNYIKCFLNNKLDDKNKEKDYNEYYSECRPEYRLEYCSKHCKYK